MIENIIKWSIKNRFIIIVATMILVAVGIYSLKNTPVDAIPDLSDVQVIIKTNYKGQAPQVVEDQVTYPIATAMLAVPKAVTVRAFSFYGDSYIYVIFEDGTDLYWARSRVLEYLNQISSKLPANAKPELGPDATGVGWVYQYALVDETGKTDLAKLRSIQDWFLKYELQTVPGVAEVATAGGMVKQYQITVDPNKLRVYGLSLDNVKNAIKKSNQEIGGSVIELGEAEHMVRATGYLKNIENIKNIPLGVNKNGTPILLSDISKIDIGPQMRRGITELNGKGEAVGGIIVMRQGENALKTINAVKDKISILQKSLPTGVKVVEVYDRSTLIGNSIENLIYTLIEEFIIVILVCSIFLFHFRSSLILLVSLPIGILSAFIIMYLQGINANIMSLGGIAISIGVMVDAAIVMIENVHKHLVTDNNNDQNRWSIIQKAALEVGPSLFFSLLIISISFLPIFALQAQEGRMFTPLAFTKTYAMAVSSGLAITLIPVLLGYFIRGKITPENKNPLNRFLIFIYRPFINLVLKFPKIILSLAFLIMIITYWPMSKLGTEFMPDLDEGDWMYMPTTLPGVSIGKARQILQQTDKLIKTFPEVKSVFGKIGRAETATDPAPLTMIETIIQLKPKSEWREGMTSEKLKEEMNKRVKLLGVTNAWVMPIKTRIDMLATGIKTPVGIKILGPDLYQIQKIGKDLEKILKKVPGTLSVYSERVFGGRYIKVDIDRKKAARYGLNITDVQEVVSSAIGGVNITETTEGLERYPVNLRYPQKYRDSVSQLKLLPIVTPGGAHIALGDVANIIIEDGPPMIKSENARLTGWIYIDINNRNLGAYVEEAKKIVNDNIKLPAGYTLSWSGQYEYMNRAKARLEIIMPITVVIIFMLLYLNFRSYKEAILIMVTLPLSLVGGIWFLYLLGYNISVAVLVGFIALAGLTIEIGVLMLVYLNQSLNLKIKKTQDSNSKLTNEDIESAIINGSVLRVRPIIMTVSSTLAGLIPIMLSTGTGAEVMRRIAAPMVGGLISSTLLTLIVIPAIYFIWKSNLMIKKSD